MAKVCPPSELSTWFVFASDENSVSPTLPFNPVTVILKSGADEPLSGRADEFDWRNVYAWTFGISGFEGPHSQKLVSPISGD